MFKIMRRIANYPPHPVIMTSGNPWQTISEHSDKIEALVAYERMFPARHHEFGLFLYGVRQEVE